jgi:hypothetical protein
MKKEKIKGEESTLMIPHVDEEVDSISKAAKEAMLDDLKRRFDNNEIVVFDYVKKSDGNLRHAIGCLHPSFIKTRIKGTGIPKPKCDTNFTYYDLDQRQFRSFNYANLVKVY